MSGETGASDPLSEARAEMVAVLTALGIADPLAVLRPVFSRVRQRWAGERVCIHHVDCVDREEREQKIRDGLATGLPIKRIAEQTGVHPTTVWRKSLRRGRDWAI